MLPQRLLALSAAALCVSAQYTLAPALQAAQDSANTTGYPNAPTTNLTDGSTILKTVGLVDQKCGAPTDDTPPGLPQAPTMLTALDGELLFSTIDGSNSTASSGGQDGPGRRSEYEMVFSGTGNDSAVQGTAFLTFFLVDNSTSYSQSLQQCFDFCDDTPNCVFVNIYYEFGNELLDFVFPEKSNLKCVKSTQPTRKTPSNCPLCLPMPRASSIAAVTATALKEPTVPEGYELVFGPISAANEAAGYMGFAFLDKYDPSACAKLCNQRGPDASGGACKYFNIWRALVHGIPTTYTCSMVRRSPSPRLLTLSIVFYSTPPPRTASTALNTGQGPLSVTRSRGYARTSYLADGDFEAYACPDGGDFCFALKALGWNCTSAVGGSFDATIFHYASYAHGGAGVALLGCAFGSDAQMGTLTATGLAELKRGRTYEVQFFYSSTYSGVQLEKDAFVEVWWNGALAGSVRVGFSSWVYFAFSVVALGGSNDMLQLKGGAAPAYSFVDDVYVFLV
ncbi:hypothetical protein C8R46DRAFT_1211047 [Mycena filopes]|nr:hypothetical protein C8R46DRAFT_1211047 [Mycena filopes]